MSKLKAFFKSKLEVAERFFKAKIAPHIEKAGPVAQVLLIIATVVVGVVLAVLFVAAVIAGIIAVKVLAPGMIVGFFVWFAWTYLQLGLTYFPDLAPVYQTIPYWHFAFGFAALILVWRVIRKKPATPTVTQAKTPK